MKISALFPIFLPGFLIAQQNTLTCGETFKHNSGSFSMSIGQIDFLENQGLQQPFIIEKLKVDELNKTIFYLFPNPTNGMLTLSIENPKFTNYSCTIYDANNRLLETIDLLSTSNHITFSNYVNGIYFVNIKENNSLKSIYKVLKIN